MEDRLIALKLFLDELNVPVDIDTLDDRKRVQKSIYLGQLSGVKLGYRFSWYILGPYSSDLAKDYYELAEEIASGENAFEAHEFQPAIRQKLKTVLPLLAVPKKINLSQESWLELVSSYHFLRKISQYDKTKTVEVFRIQKPHLLAFVNEAEKILKTNEFL